MEKEIKHQDLVRIRNKKQKKLALQKGRTSKDVFVVGDVVRVQDVISKRWQKESVIAKDCKSDDGQLVSFMVNLREGGQTL